MAEPSDIQRWIRYNQDYFCGSNVQIFFGDVWVDELITLQYSASQQKTPIYGYASQQFDAIAEGQFIIQGQFTINFKETGYLNIIHDKIQGNLDQKEIYKEIQQKRRKQEWLNLVGANTANDSALEREGSQKLRNHTPFLGYTVKNINGKLVRQPRLSQLTVEDQLGEFGSNVSPGFEDLAENLEDTIWGVEIDGEQSFGAVNNFLRKGKGRVTRPDEFGRKFDEFKNSYIDPRGFNLLVTYGNINDSAAEHTIQSLVGIHLTDVSQVIMPTGEPVAEQYTFFARGLNERIGTFNLKPTKLKPAFQGPQQFDNTRILDSDILVAVEVKMKIRKIRSLLGSDSLFPDAKISLVIDLNVSEETNTLNIGKQAVIESLVKDQILDGGRIGQDQIIDAQSLSDGDVFALTTVGIFKDGSKISIPNIEGIVRGLTLRAN